MQSPRSRQLRSRSVGSAAAREADDDTGRQRDAVASMLPGRTTEVESIRPLPPVQDPDSDPDPDPNVAAGLAEVLAQNTMPPSSTNDDDNHAVNRDKCVDPEDQVEQTGLLVTFFLLFSL